jgi:hypothetical protein
MYFSFFNNGGVGLGYCCFSTGLLVFAVGISAAYFLFFLSVCIIEVVLEKGFAFRTMMFFSGMGYSDKLTIVIPYNRV